MRKLAIVPIALLLMFATACPKVEQNARDTAAALSGAITAAQTQYQQQCSASPTAQPCTTINQAVAAQNALVTAIEGYCGWSVVNPPGPTSTCTPVKSAQAGLQTAINNANLFITELKGVIK